MFSLIEIISMAVSEEKERSLTIYLGEFCAKFKNSMLPFEFDSSFYSSYFSMVHDCYFSGFFSLLMIRFDKNTSIESDLKDFCV